MKGKRTLAAVSILALTLVSLSVLASIASGQEVGTTRSGEPDAAVESGAPTYEALSPEPSPFEPEEAATLLPTAPPLTQLAYVQVDLAAGATGAAAAACPTGSVVVGGGYAANPDVAFYTQYMYGNGWRGDAKNNAGVSRRITVFAVCLHNAPGASVIQVHGQVIVPPGDKKQAVADCPAGSIVTGGGFHAYADGSLRVYNTSQHGSQEGWQSWAQNLSGADRTHHAYAICLSGIGGATAQILKSATIPAGSTGYAVPICPSGSLVTGGGFAAQEDLTINSSTGPYSDDEWRVYAQNTHASASRLLYGYAMCLSLPAYRVTLPLVAKEYVP